MATKLVIAGVVLGELAFVGATAFAAKRAAPQQNFSEVQADTMNMVSMDSSLITRPLTIGDTIEPRFFIAGGCGLTVAPGRIIVGGANAQRCRIILRLMRKGSGAVIHADTIPTITYGVGGVPASYEPTKVVIDWLYRNYTQMAVGDSNRTRPVVYNAQGQYLTGRPYCLRAETGNVVAVGAGCDTSAIPFRLTGGQ